MITEIVITSEHPDGLHEAQEEVNECISRIMSAVMQVNPPGEWELTNEQAMEPIHSGKSSYAPLPSTTRQVFTFTANDNVLVGGTQHGS